MHVLDRQATPQLESTEATFTISALYLYQSFFKLKTVHISVLQRSRSQETDKQAIAKLKQDHMDITGYLHYARAREIGWQAVGKPEQDPIRLEN